VTYNDTIAAQVIVDALTGLVTGNDKVSYLDLFAAIARGGVELTCMRSAACGYGWKIVVAGTCVLWYEGVTRRLRSDYLFECGYVDVPDYSTQWLRVYQPGAWESKLIVDINTLRSST
jgi:hypothetical protein